MVPAQVLTRVTCDQRNYKRTEIRVTRQLSSNQLIIWQPQHILLLLFNERRIKRALSDSSSFRTFNARPHALEEPSGTRRDVAHSEQVFHF